MIYKYRLSEFGKAKITVPCVYEFLSVGESDGVPVVWLEVNLSAEEKEIEFLSRFTGMEQSEFPGGEFKGTVSLKSGLVVHVFQTKK